MYPNDENNDRISAEDLLEKLNKLQNNEETYQDNTNNENIVNENITANDNSNVEKSSGYGDLIQQINTYQKNDTNQNSTNTSTKNGNYSPYDIYSSRKRLESNIEEAEKYVNEKVKKKHTEQIGTPLVDNIDNFVSDNNKNNKKGLFSSLFKSNKKKLPEAPSIVDANGENMVDLDNDNVYVEELEDTAELIAFEPPIDAIESSTIADPNAHGEDNSINDDKSSETAVMMMALGYNTSQRDGAKEIKLDESETNQLDVTDSIGTTTSLVDKMAREELQHEDIEASSDKIRAVYKKLYRKHNSLKLRLIGISLLSLLLIAFEILSPTLKWSPPPILSIGIDWILVLFIALISYDRISSGFKQLFTFKFDSDVVLVISLLFSLAFTIVITIQGTVVVLFNASFGICSIFSFISAILTSKRDIYSFRVASSKKDKKVIIPSGNNNNEKETYEVKNVKYINEFFANKDIKATRKKVLNIIIPIYLLISIATLVILLVLGENAYTYLSASYLMFSMLAPTSLFISYSYPYFRLSKKSYNLATAVLGEKSIEEYDNAKTIVFDDLDAFPPEKTKLKTITIYKSNSDISEIIYYVSSLFSKVGGPLETVFKSATLDSKVSDDVKINTIDKKGIDAYIDGKRIVVGQPDYMRQQCFETVNDDDDISTTLSSNKRVLYIACEEKVLAKFYIQYVTTKEFIRTVAYLNKLKLKTIIRSTDPCIDEGLLEMNRLNKSKYDIDIIKTNERNETMDVVSAKKAGVIGTGTTKNLIKTLSMCRSMPKLYLLNLIVQILTSVIGAILIGVVIFTGNLPRILSIYPILYQAVCAFIIYIISLIFI